MMKYEIKNVITVQLIDKKTGEVIAEQKVENLDKNKEGHNEGTRKN